LIEFAPPRQLKRYALTLRRSRIKFTNRVRTFFSIFAWTGFLASILVHSVTFRGINAADYVPWVWVLHVGCFIAIIPLVRKDVWRDVVAVVPRWAQAMIVFFMAYAVINFVLSFVLSEGGANPDIWDGRYVLQSHGKLVRELSEREYHLQLAYVLRGFSGHWMLFYFLPGIYSWYRND
jgi:uncharacterized membrane protein